MIKLNEDAYVGFKYEIKNMIGERLTKNLTANEQHIISLIIDRYKNYDDNNIIGIDCITARVWLVNEPIQIVYTLYCDYNFDDNINYNDWIKAMNNGEKSTQRRTIDAITSAIENAIKYDVIELL